MKRLALFAFVLANALACGANLAAIDDATDPTIAAKLAKCRAEMRAARADASANDAFAVYEACKKREGVDK